jgi:hypothetical protein
MGRLQRRSRKMSDPLPRNVSLQAGPYLRFFRRSSCWQVSGTTD